jgi:hypothetical protein
LVIEIDNDKFSIFNSRLPSKARFPGAASIRFELRLIIGACFCAAPDRRRGVAAVCRQAE